MPSHREIMTSNTSTRCTILRAIDFHRVNCEVSAKLLANEPHSFSFQTRVSQGGRKDIAPRILCAYVGGGSKPYGQVLRMFGGPPFAPPPSAHCWSILCDREWVNNFLPPRIDSLVPRQATPPVSPFSSWSQLQILGLCPNNGGPRLLLEPQQELPTPSTAQTPQVCAPVIAQNIDYDAPDATAMVGWAAVNNRPCILHVSPSAEYFTRSSIAVRKSAGRGDTRMADRHPPA